VSAAEAAAGQVLPNSPDSASDASAPRENPPAPHARPGAQDAASVLQRKVHLRDIIDMASLQSVCDAFSSLWDVAVKVFDADGAKMVDAKVDSGLCAYVFTFPRGRSQCTKLVGEIKSLSVQGVRVAERQCFTGNRYRIVPLVYDAEYLGKLVFGPYFPSDMAEFPESLVHLDARIDRGALGELAARYARLDDATVDRAVAALAKTLDVLLFTGYRSHLASTMHLEAIGESYRELNEKNRRLQDSYDRLRELDRLKSNFLATVSHELRTPLTSVIGYSEMLLDGLAGEMSKEQRDYVKTIMEKGESLLHMISSILDVSKIEQGQLKLNLSLVDIGAIAEEAVEVVRPLAVRKRLALEIAMSGALPRFHADRDKVRQVLINLLGNAVKFTPEHGIIRVLIDLASMPGGRTDEADALFSPYAGNAMRVRVADTGIGIPEDRLEKIFDIFYQVDNSSTREYGGCGLGLSIVKSYVEAHGGRVSVESEVARGSVFSTFWPLLDAVEP
jgi:signal transduction histidine kinase